MVEREKPWIRVWVKVYFVEEHLFGFEAGSLGKCHYSTCPFTPNCLCYATDTQIEAKC